MEVSEVLDSLAMTRWKVESAFARCQMQRMVASRRLQLMPLPDLRSPTMLMGELSC
ncbi:hypothetical protein [Phormidium nigroviride]